MTMALIEINKNPSQRELKWFGVLLALFFTVVGGVLWWRAAQPTAATVTLGLGLVLVAVYAAFPGLRRWVYLGWMYAALPIGWVVSHVLLGIIFYLIMTPIGLTMRLFGYDPMSRQFDRGADTYWRRRDSESDTRRYFRQF
jgi:TRAP-type C4-dicarboxylate transport system permease small subunit